MHIITCLEKHQSMFICFSFILKSNSDFFENHIYISINKSEDLTNCVYVLISNNYLPLSPYNWLYIYVFHRKFYLRIHKIVLQYYNTKNHRHWHLIFLHRQTWSLSLETSSNVHLFQFYFEVKQWFFWKPYIFK